MLSPKKVPLELVVKENLGGYVHYTFERTGNDEKKTSSGDGRDYQTLIRSSTSKPVAAPDGSNLVFLEDQGCSEP